MNRPYHRPLLWMKAYQPFSIKKVFIPFSIKYENLIILKTLAKSGLRAYGSVF